MNSLSEKEQALLDFIKTNETENVTIKFIEEKLGTPYVGAIGRLVRENLVKIEKRRIENVSNSYGRKQIKCYVIDRGDDNATSPV